MAIRPFDWALTERVAGMAAAAAGLWDEAESHFTEALAQAEKLPNVLDEPQVRHRYGKMLLDRGRTEDRDRAREMVSSALERYRRMGMPIHAAMAEELLRGV